MPGCTAAAPANVCCKTYAVNAHAHTPVGNNTLGAAEGPEDSKSVVWIAVIGSFAMVAALLAVSYKVTIPLVQNLLLTSEQKFRFGLACPYLARPKQNFTFEVNGRFCTR